jgi:demethylmenaquinone methyltransferase/2-methoxy-6-polyprenyl-1,4-benzoquinol methylase
MAFGLRNLADPGRGLDEMRRVVRPGGRMVVLEFVRPPRNLIGACYRVYLTQILPRVGGLVSGDRAAYRYLGDTVDSYRSPEQLRELAAGAGWSQVEFRGLMLGTVGLLTGTR